MLAEFIEPGIPYSRRQIDQISEYIGFSLPEDYCEFVMKYGNAFVGGLVDSSIELPILSFFGFERLMSTIKENDEFIKSKAVPIADCELGNTWVLSNTGDVYYVNYYNTSIVSTKVAPSFTDFASRIDIEDEVP